MLGLMVACMVIFLYLLFGSWHYVVGASLLSQTGWFFCG